MVGLKVYFHLKYDKTVLKWGNHDSPSSETFSGMFHCNWINSLEMFKGRQTDIDFYMYGQNICNITINGYYFKDYNKLLMNSYYTL